MVHSRVKLTYLKNSNSLLVILHNNGINFDGNLLIFCGLLLFCSACAESSELFDQTSTSHRGNPRRYDQSRH